MAEARRWARTSPPIGAVARALALLAVFGLAACGPSTEDLYLASTTSTYDSGLLDELIPAFREAYPLYSVKVIVVGSGEALELGRRKDVDVLLTHAPAAELDFVRDGFGLERTPFMYNDFLVLGPAEDPAGLREAAGAADGLRRIAAAQVEFVSRGDDSGTHKRERFLWSLAGVEPAGEWYREAGEGMAASLLVADAGGAHILADRATYASLVHRLEVVPLLEGDPMLLNVYSVIRVAGVRREGAARDFARWLVSDRGLGRIAAFGRDSGEEPMFLPITHEHPSPVALRSLEEALSGRSRMDTAPAGS